MNVIKKGALILFLLMTVLQLSQCRYHLRGTGSHDALFSQTRMAIQSKHTNSPFIKTLQQTLQTMGVQLTDKDKAEVIVKIQNAELSQTTLAVSTNTQIHTVKLTFHVTYQLSNSRGEPLTPVRVLSYSQSVSTDDNQMIGATHEKWQIERALHQEISYQLINQLRAYVAASHSPSRPAVTESHNPSRPSVGESHHAH